MQDERSLYVPEGGGFAGTILTQGTWDPGAQTGAAVLALLGHCLEDLPTSGPMALVRLTVDLVRPVPIGKRLDVSSEVVREGRKIQLAQLDLRTDGELLVRASALRLRDQNMERFAPVLPPPSPGPAPVLPDPADCERLGGSRTSPRFLEGIELRRAHGLGMWVRLAVPVVAGEPIRATSHVTVALDFTHLVNADIASAMPVVTIINPDISTHVLRPPRSRWIGVTGGTSFDPGTGRGMSVATLSDEAGAFGVASTSGIIQVR